MKKELRAMRRHDTDHRGERGQILILFVLAVVAIVGMLGLVLDGGAAYAQRRAEQGVADLASMAGATAYLNTQGDVATKTAAADAAARVIATANGFTDGVDDAVVDIVIAGSSAGAIVRANVSDKHNNHFAGLLGMPTWDVSVTAAAEASDRPNGAMGAMPLLFNEAAFPANCDETAGTCITQTYQMPGSGNEDVPQDATQFNWTIFCMAGGSDCNADSDGVREVIDGDAVDSCSPGGIVDREPCVIYTDDVIAPLNAGSHTTLFSSLEAHVGDAFPVPIVDNDGVMVGFAYFRLLSVEGGSDKVIKGYFISPVNVSELVVNPDHANASLNTGVIKLDLVD
jgi:hypothetical protein